MTHRRLGRGLDSLIAPSDDAAPRGPLPSVPPPPDAATSTAVQADELRQSVGLPMELEVERVRPNPFQPRKDFNDDQLQDLMQSISSNGIIQPIVVRRTPDDGFELVSGERRLRAVMALGGEKIPAVVKNVPDERLLELALIENIQREDLNPIEKAEGFREFLERYHLTQEDAATRIGIDRATVSNHLRLLDLPTEVQTLVRRGALGMGHARAVAALDGEGRQIELAARACREGWSVRQTERAVAAILAGKRQPRSGGQSKSAQVAAMENQLRQALGTKVRIEEGAKRGSGRIVIEYYSFDDFDRILSVLRR